MQTFFKRESKDSNDFVMAGVTMALFGGCFFIMLLVFLIRPLLLIWGLNGLLGAKIEFTFWNIIYGAAICAALSSVSASGKCKEK